MTFKEKYGNTALVAGASEGMGAAYAYALAARGLNLVLIARRKEPLEATARQITKQFGVKVLPIVCDLAAADATQQIVHATGDVVIDFLVYNAALSYIGPYLATHLSTHTNIATVNALTPLAMLHYFGGKMVERHKGGIVIMASIAGFQGSGYLSTYAATKAFNRVLAEGLWYEWRPLGVDVIACCAGAIATPNYINTKPVKASPIEPRVQLPEEVVEECLRRIGTTPSFVSGTGNKLVSFLMQHVFSRKKAVTMMGDSMKKMYRIVR
ncbi:SDR family NAD(P)-dependent oxidoreductase [Chitinophaga sp. 30R24]|uniref:SDR family NAD(P)-dependent oxidoreductase n=1 Tax=Chitinophaga sp. 30R24 TaxID=3248838 RepID=UPI003B9171A7